jgi:hypothetical protein
MLGPYGITPAGHVLSVCPAQWRAAHTTLTRVWNVTEGWPKLFDAATADNGHDGCRAAPDDVHD